MDFYANSRVAGVSFALGVGAGLALGFVLPSPADRQRRSAASTGTPPNTGASSPAGAAFPPEMPSPALEEFYVGIDVGGTTIGVGVVRGDGKMVACSEQCIPEGAESRSASRIIDLIVELSILSELVNAPDHGHVRQALR